MSREKLSESTKERKKGLTPKKALATVLAFGSLAIPLSGCGKAATTTSHTPSPNNTELPSQSPTATPSAEASPSPSATPEKAPTQQEVDAYASWAEKYTGMDVDTFEALPRDERLAYAQYLMDYTVAHNVYNAMYNDEYSSNGDYKITPLVVSPEDTGQDILLNYGYHQQLAFLQLAEGVSTPTLDKTKAQEALSAVLYDAGMTLDIQDSSGQSISIENQNRPTAITFDWTALHTSELQNGHDGRGNKVQYKIVAFHDRPSDPDGGRTKYAEFVYGTFTSYDGSQQSIWLLDTIGKSMNNLRANATVK
jgi:hypothetical protein